MSETDVVGQLCLSYCDALWHFDPVEGSSAGATSHDDRLGTFTTDRVRQHVAGLRSLMGAVEEADVSSRDVEIDRTALLDHIRVEEHRWRVERPHQRDPGLWIAHVLEGLQQLLLIRAPSAARGASLAARLRAIPAVLADAQATLADCPRLLVETAAASLEVATGLVAEADTAARAHLDLAEGLVPAAGEATAALTAFGAHLQSMLKAGSPEEPWGIGRDGLLFRLRHQLAIAASPEELLSHVAELVQATERELTVLAQRLGKARWQDALADLQARAPVGADTVAAHEEVLGRARRHLEQHPVVTVGDGPLQVLPTPAYARPWIPVAAYLPPAPLGDDRIGRLFVTERPDDPQRAGAAVAVAIAHEALPGHHLQFLAARAQASPVRRLLYSPATVEGWGLYAEALMDETGFYRDDAERFFRLLALYRRSLRVGLDVGVHTGSLTAEAALRFARDRMLCAPAQAVAEVHRAYAAPAYQLAYAAGYRELLALRADLGVTGEHDLRAFHDRVLSYGGLPWSLIRWGMSNEPA